MKILIVTYYWPPSGGGGVQRWLKFATCLDKLGHEVVVYTPVNPDAPIIDNSLEAEIPSGITVIKKPIFEPSRFVSALTKKGSNGRIGASGGGEKKSVTSKLAHWIRGNFFVPDARVRWVKPSVKFLKKWLSDNHIDAIITTGPPHSMHLIGLGLKKSYPQLKWISDFRDPWSDMDYLSEFKMGSRAVKKMLRYERAVAKNSDHLIVTSKGASNKLLEHTNTDCSIIPNGWDPGDFPKSLNKKQKSNVLRIGHFGSLHGSRNARGLWAALEKLNKEGRAFELIFAGTVSSEIKQELASYSFSEKCVFMDGLPHKKSIEEMLQCDALLLVHNDTESATKSTPGKLFEYIATAKPIISICRKEGDLAFRLSEMNLPFVEHDNAEKAYEIITQFSTQTSVDAGPFTRMALTEKLIDVLKKITQ